MILGFSMILIMMIKKEITYFNCQELSQIGLDPKSKLNHSLQRHKHVYFQLR